MEELATILEDANEVFCYRDGRPPSERAYDYLEDQGIFKPRGETAPQCAAKHLIGRAWDAASDGADPEALGRVERALDELIDAVDAILPEQEDER